ncbi:MAG: YheC/YheD family protein, partial [Syntrophomonadaceae bacterium]|nr:YheC/YheD family protein [Syntrophomonadaceae bacterium]MDD4561886.1 YheC/YheD family protein [Syntrophomonadaceae bacterium]
TSRLDKNTLYMNPSLVKKVFLQEDRKYGINFSQDEIHIGPVVGIIAPKQDSTNRPYGGQTTFFQEIMAGSRKLGQICFAFYFSDIDWNKKIVNGYYHNKNGWQRGKFPLPDVIYPRSKFYVSNQADSRRRLKQAGIKILNPQMVGKWEAYRLFKRNPDMLPYLPETRLVNSFRQVEIMAKKYRAVYLKPVNGTQGKNIIRVNRNRKSPGYCYQYHCNGSLCKGSASDLLQLRKKLRPVMAGRSYLVQKEINLLRYEGGIADIRVMVQKEHNGRWEVTGMACRVGKPGAITSNISGGGSGMRVETVLRKSFHGRKQVNQIIETIIFVAINAALSVEEYLGNCGEAGVDIGVDKYGKVWFIEANLRPARRVFTLIGETQTRQKSIETPLLYARYLAGF